ARARLGTLEGTCILVVGAGKMGRTAVKRLRGEGAQRVIVANRTISRSRGLVTDAGFGEAVEMPELVEALAAADVVVASTGASNFVLDETRVRAAMSQRPHRPLFLVDIAVPRDVDPAVTNVENVSLVDIDGLKSVVNERLDLRREAIPAVEEIIAEYVERFENWYRSRVAVPVIARLTQKAEMIRAAELERLLARCPDLDERERMLVTGMTMTIVSKLLHSAILKIREKATFDHAEALSSARVLDDLFELDLADGPK
ncbi:MAG: glutamyl-tRNA reductase, partial [Candidatus Cybelea sp.]